MRIQADVACLIGEVRDEPALRLSFLLRQIRTSYSIPDIEEVWQLCVQRAFIDDLLA